MDSPMRLDRWGGCKESLVMRTWLSGLLSGTNATDVLAGYPSCVRIMFPPCSMLHTHPECAILTQSWCGLNCTVRDGWIRSGRLVGCCHDHEHTTTTRLPTGYSSFMRLISHPISSDIHTQPSVLTAMYSSRLCTRRRAGGGWRPVIWPIGSQLSRDHGANKRTEVSP